MIRLQGIGILILLVVVACDSQPQMRAQSYRTDGTGKIQTCRGAGIEFCTYEVMEVPQQIDAHDPRWSSTRAERKSDDLTMCYRNLPGGIFSERLLMFRCEPLDRRLPTFASADSQHLKAKLIENFKALAGAGARIEVCASDERTSAEQSLGWYEHLLNIQQIVMDLSDHFHDEMFYLAFELTRFQISQDENFRDETFDNTDGCASAALLNAEQYVEKAQEVANFYLAFPSISLDGDAANPASSPTAE